MNEGEVRATGEWFRLWEVAPVFTMGSRFGYLQQDIASALYWLKQVYDPTWVQANPNHPIVVSLFAPESVMNFLQVVDLGYAIATFPPVLQGNRGTRVSGDLRSQQSFYPAEYEIRVLSRVAKLVRSIDLGNTAARAEARIQHAGQDYDIEIFRKEWSSYGKEALSGLARYGKPVDSAELRSRELKRLKQEIYERFKKVDKAIPMVFICSPPPYLMVWFTMNRTHDKTHTERLVSEIFRSVSRSVTEQFRDQLRKVAKLVIDIPDLVSHSDDSIPNHKDSPSEFICCGNPYFVT